MNRTVLLIGGLDSSGGAGLLRDALAVAAFGGHPRLAATAVTAQSDLAVTAVHPVPPETVSAQIAAADPIAAVKIGMLGSARIAAAVARALPDAPCVIDPVLCSSSGHPLLEPEGLPVLLSDLIPRARLVTPNLPELEVLAGHLGRPGNATQAIKAGALLQRGCGAVLVKGGHAAATGTCEDRLYLADGAVRIFRGPRFGHSLRGTGCHLASAIAAGLAAGMGLEPAIEAARRHLRARFRQAPAGSGAEGPAPLDARSGPAPLRREGRPPR